MSASKLALPADRKTADALAAALGSILRYGVEQLARVDTNPAKAVHEFRKSVRRARSLVRVARPSLSKRALRAISVQLKDAHRSSSSLRDAEILTEAIALSGEPSTPELRSAVEKHRGEELETERIRVTLQRASDLPERVVESFRAVLPDELTLDDLLEGVRKTYKQARRELHRAKRIPDPTHIHNWRKRNKDVVHQLELLLPVLGESAPVVHENLQALSHELGLITDLFVLRRFLRGEPGLDEAADRVHKLAIKRFKSARKGGEEYYSLKPRKLVAKLS